MMALVILLSCALASAQEPLAKEHFARGKALIEANCGDCMGRTRQGLEKGISEVLKAIEAGYDDQIAAYKLLAEAYNTLAYVDAGRDPKEQKEVILLQKAALEKVLTLNPGDGPTRVQYARVVGDRKMMIAALREVLAADPNNAEIRNLLGISLVEVGQIEEGVVHLKKSVELANPYWARTYGDRGRALLLDKGKKVEAAEVARVMQEKKQRYLLSSQTLEKLSQLKPGGGRIRSEYARVVGDPEKNLGALQDIVAAYPNDILARFSLGMSLVYNAQFAEGTRFLKQVVESAAPNKAQIYGNIARKFLIEEGRITEAAEIAELMKKKKAKPN